ncbi:MAG TPA: FKBP-type peptidyl-prolyl cis-trans isomerase [Bacteroidia bacterium]|jgi:FKBP-type peptidyl-prolyl cis-trans isomerase FkpA|nr:FKBP-type peptidyl-prolyl cis-trans isomerase [Bacteroidia bacterium]
MNKNLVLTTSIAVLAMVSCKNSDFDGYTKAENGLNYKFYNHDENGMHPKEGDGVAFSFIIKKRSNDSVLVDSKTITGDGSGVFRYMLPKSSFVGSIEDALAMMSKGDSASFIVNADSFFLKTQRAKELPPHIKPGEFLTISIKVAEVKPRAEIEVEQKKKQAEMQKMAMEMQAKEKPAFDKYLADNKITTKPTASGLIYIETKKGSGAHPAATDQVVVNYLGTLLDGTKFDSSADHGGPATFGLNQVIPGWTEGLQLMAKGGKAKLVIPSALGWGPQGNGQVIPPYAPVVFEVELVDIKAPQAEVTPTPPGK